MHDACLLCDGVEQMQPPWHIWEKERSNIDIIHQLLGHIICFLIILDLEYSSVMLYSIKITNLELIVVAMVFVVN